MKSKSVAKKQGGFAGMYALVVVLAVVLIAGVGWVVWNNKEDAKNPSKQDTSQATETTPDCTGSNLSQFCIERAPAEKTKFSKLPADLQTVVKATYAAQTPACLKDDQIVDADGTAVDPAVHYAPIGSAIVGIGCDGGSASLFVKDVKTDEWKFAEQTQTAFTCDAVFNHSVPKALLSFDGAAECVNGTEVQKYDDASAERFL